MNSNGGTADAQAPMENEGVSHGKPSFKDMIRENEEKLDDKGFLDFLDRRMRRAKALLQKAATGEDLGPDTEESRQKLLDALFADGAVGNGGDPVDFVTKSRDKDRKGYKKKEKADKEKIIAEDTRGDTWANGTTRRKKPKLIYVVDDADDQEPNLDEDAELTDPIYKGMNAALNEIAGFLVRYRGAYNRASRELKKFEKSTDKKKESLNQKEEKKIMKKKDIRKYYGQLKTLIEAIQSWMVDFEAHAYDNREPASVSITDIHPISLVPDYELITVKIKYLNADWPMLKVQMTEEYVVCMLTYDDGQGNVFGLDDLEDDENAYLASLGDKCEIFESDDTDFSGPVTLIRFAMDDELFDFLPYVEPETSTALKQDPTFELKENGDGMDDSLDGAAGKEVEPEEEEESSSDSESEASESGGEEFDSGSDNESSSGSEEDSDDETPVRKRKPAASAKPAAPAAATAAAPAAMTKEDEYPLCSSRWLLALELRNNNVTEEQARQLLLCLKGMRPPGDEDDEPLCALNTIQSATRDLKEGSSKKPRNK
jgi:hypothetical protein